MAEHNVIIVKKKIVGGHAHHGGSWKVAYADFVTAMMAFFMVMWIMGLSDDTRTKIQGYFNDPLGFNKQSPRSKSIVQLNMSGSPKGHTKGQTRDDKPGNNGSEIDKAKGKFEKIIKNDPAFKGMKENIEITLTAEGLRIDFKETARPVFFNSGSKELQPEAEKLIEQIAPVLKETKCSIMVEGHTDAKPYAGQGYTNFNLSTDRASSLYRALREGGVADDQFKAVNGFGPSRLRYPGNPLDPRNRRVSILVPYEQSKGILGSADKQPKPTITKPVKIAPPKVDLTNSGQSR